MQRRIQAQSLQIAANQALIDHKQATLNVLLSQIPDISTFAQIGQLIGYSHEWVRQRLTKSPRAAVQDGEALQSAQGRRGDFVRSVFN